MMGKFNSILETAEVGIHTLEYRAREISESLARETKQ